MPPLPQPPANLADWIILIGLVGSAIIAMRKWIVQPMLDELHQHTLDHEEARKVRDLVKQQLTPNGTDVQLPQEERDKPLRDIAIKGLIAIRHLERRLESHEAYSRQIVATLNAERSAEGHGALPTEGSGL